MPRRAVRRTVRHGEAYATTIALFERREHVGSPFDLFLLLDVESRGAPSKALSTADDGSGGDDR